MNRRPRTYYTDTQRALMWERWKAGWTLHQIGHLFDRPHTSIHNVLSRTGGIRPPERRRSKAALSLSEREEISRALVVGETLRSIAARLGRAPSTVSRELKRNGGREGYRATQADSVAWDRALRPKRCKLAKNRALAGVVADKLRLLLVARADLWMAQAYLSVRRELPSVTRDHLSQSIHSSAWLLKEGAAGSS